MMLMRESDWLIVLRVWESQAHGEAASSLRTQQGKHDPLFNERPGPLFKERMKTYHEN